MVVREVQLPEVDESPGDDRREGGQAVGGKVQLSDLAGDVYEPVDIHPGQLEVGPFHTQSLGMGDRGRAPVGGERRAGVGLGYSSDLFTL